MGQCVAECLRSASDFPAHSRDEDRRSLCRKAYLLHAMRCVHSPPVLHRLGFRRARRFHCRRARDGPIIREKSINNRASIRMDTQTHWEKIYTEKAPDAVSWYRPHLETSLALIEQAAASCSASIIDVGGGESTLVDDLLARGYDSITVLDISQTAIDANRKRLGKTSDRVYWVV